MIVESIEKWIEAEFETSHLKKAYRVVKFHLNRLAEEDNGLFVLENGRLSRLEEGGSKTERWESRNSRGSIQMNSMSRKFSFVDESSLSPSSGHRSSMSRMEGGAGKQISKKFSFNETYSPPPSSPSHTESSTPLGSGFSMYENPIARGIDRSTDSSTRGRTKMTTEARSPTSSPQTSKPPARKSGLSHLLRLTPDSVLRSHGSKENEEDVSFEMHENPMAGRGRGKEQREEKSTGRPDRRIEAKFESRHRAVKRSSFVKALKKAVSVYAFDIEEEEEESTSTDTLNPINSLYGENKTSSL
jgi:hypothetical protein